MEQLRAIDWEAGLEFLQCVCHVNSHREKDKRPRVGGFSIPYTSPTHLLPLLPALLVHVDCRPLLSRLLLLSLPPAQHMCCHCSLSFPEVICKSSRVGMKGRRGLEIVGAYH